MKKKTFFLLIYTASILISTVGCELPNLSNDALSGSGGSSAPAVLTAYYPFNGNADDESGKGSDGYAVSAVLVNDRFENAMSAYQFYSSQDSRIQIIGAKSVKFGSGDFSINVWSYGLGAGVYPGALFLHTDLSNGWGLTTYTVPQFTWYHDPSLMVSVSTIATLNTWQNICVVRKNDIFSLYIDKVKIGEASQSAAVNNYFVSVIGAGVNGMVDDVRVYKNALTQGEIETLYHTGGWDSGPEINLKQGSSDILSGPEWYDFGDNNVGVSSTPVYFTIENNGTEDLIISSVTSSDGQFVVDTASLTSPIAPGESTTFAVAFTPSSTGSQQSTITVNNNDSDEGSYTFAAIGMGI